jgi:phosphoglycerate kinase
LRADLPCGVAADKANRDPQSIRAIAVDLFGEKMRTLKDGDFAGKKVLLRVDYNVPISEGTVTDDKRIAGTIPTIQYLLNAGASIIIISHLGRPKGEGFEAQFSMAPAARVVSRYIARDVHLIDDIIGGAAKEAASELAPGEVIMLENLRFDAREKKNDSDFAKGLAALADAYVDDAFGATHRAHASIVALAEELPSYAGLLVEAEVKMLREALGSPNKPFVSILGGSKTSDKIKLISRLIDVVDTLIIGGGMCFTFLVAKGYDVGASLVEADYIDTAKDLMEQAENADVKVLLPIDLIVADSVQENIEVSVCDIDQIPNSKMGLDIGPATSELFKKEIAKANTVFWNGPMGVFELKPFENGTKQIAQALGRNQKALTIVGGGDSASAIKKFELEDKMSFISTGGGASMQFIEGSPLPGIEVLK